MKGLNELYLQADRVITQGRSLVSAANQVIDEVEQLRRDLQQFAAEQSGEVQADKCLTDERE